LKQFTVRVPALAAEVGLQQFDRDWAERTYKLRSKVAHGVPILQSPDGQERNLEANELNAAMTELDELLRRICRGRDGTLVEIQCPACGSRWL
jgi:hypothetical protein